MLATNYNPILDVDSYKCSHWEQIPPGTRYISSYIESRGGRWDRTLFFGLQVFLKKYLSVQITMDMVDEAEALITAHGEPFNREGWTRIVEEHDGYFPVEIQAVPEGTIIATSNALVQVTNTDPELPWVSSYVETAILRSVWYPTTVATLSYMIKQNIIENLNETSDDPSEVAFKLHDFGFRGVSSLESGSLGGLSHIVNFMGTDTVGALIYAMRYYGCDAPPAFSIPASEHSTITSWGRDGEIDAYENMIEKFGGEGKIYACVSDSYDIWAAVEMWKKLEPKILEKGGTLVIRPDSGNPVEIVTKLAGRLMDAFGYTVNSKGYKVLPSHIRMIQGDGVNEQSIRDILNALRFKGISGSNIAFGMGSALLQNLERDTLKFAMKASYIEFDGGLARDVYKDPITDPGKRSKKGIQAVMLNGDRGYETFPAATVPEFRNILKPVWRDGCLLTEYTLEEVRERTNG